MDHEVVKNVDLEGVELKQVTDIGFGITASFSPISSSPAHENKIPSFQIVISHSGRLLFVGTRHGTIRAIKFPLAMPIEFVEYQAHATAVTSLVLSNDDQFLVSSSSDATVIVWRVIDKGVGGKGEILGMLRIGRDGRRKTRMTIQR